jgi:hypothetical protein
MMAETKTVKVKVLRNCGAAYPDQFYTAGTEVEVPEALYLEYSKAGEAVGKPYFELVTTPKAGKDK